MENLLLVVKEELGSLLHYSVLKIKQSVRLLIFRYKCAPAVGCISVFKEFTTEQSFDVVQAIVIKCLVLVCFQIHRPYHVYKLVFRLHLRKLQ